MIGQADILKAVVASWGAGGLDGHFTQHWPAGLADEFSPLYDGQTPGCPWPRCEFNAPAPTTAVRMTAGPKTGGAQRRRELRDQFYEFRVYARGTESGGLGAQDMAAALAAKIIERYGGHPTVTPAPLTLDNGGVVYVQYNTDYGVPQGEDEYLWVIRYKIQVDVPVAA